MKKIYYVKEAFQSRREYNFYLYFNSEEYYYEVFGYDDINSYTKMKNCSIKQEKQYSIYYSTMLEKLK